MKKRLLAGLLIITIAISNSAIAFASESEQNPEETNIIPDTETDMNEVSVPDTEEPGEQEINADEQNGDEIEGSVLRGNDSPQEVAEKPELSYRVHVQTYGWQDFKKAGELAGTAGQSKRLEGIELKLGDSTYSGGIRYRTHVQTYGWQDWVSDGAMSGTSGQAKRLEAIQIELTDELKAHYDIYYRVHAQSFGWLGWAKNGEKAGTASYAKRLEAIEVVLTEKGQSAPDTEGQEAYIAPKLQYCTHVQSYGWQSTVSDGALSGTTGIGKRLEGIKINLYDTEDLGYEGGIRYRTHVQSYGWMDWAYDGTLSGTTGKSKRLEAIRIELTGELGNHYSVFYRVHSQTKGWLGWAKDGENAGTEGFSKRLEAIEIKILPKDSADCPDTSAQAYLTTYKDEDLSLNGYVTEKRVIEETVDESESEDSEEIKEEFIETEVFSNGNNQALGLDYKEGRILESFGITLDQSNPNVPKGTIEYSAHCQSYGWMDWKTGGELAGTSGEYKRLEAIKVRLTGDLAQFYDVYYRSNINMYGWLGWAKNGDASGSQGYSIPINFIQVRLVPKNQSGPIAGGAYVRSSGKGILLPPIRKAVISDYFGPRVAPTAGASTNHKGIDYAAFLNEPIFASKSGKVVEVAYNYARGKYVKIDHGMGLLTLYQHCNSISVQKGQTVSTGQEIAKVGSTGISTGPHLHFEVWENGVPVDPLKYL